MAEFEINENKKLININYILQPATIAFLLLAVFGALNSVYEIEISKMGIAIALIMSAIASYIFVHIKKRYQFAIAGMAVIFVVFTVYYKSSKFIEWITAAVQPYYNSFVERSNDYYGAIWEFIYTEPLKHEDLILLFVVGFVFGIILALILKKGKGVLLALIIALIPVIADSYVGFLPSPVSGWLLLVAVVLYLYCYKFKEITVTEIYAILGTVLASLLVVGAISLPLVETYVSDNEEDYLAIRSKIYEMQSLEKLKSFHPEEFFDIDSKGIANFAEGGIGKGDFSNVERFKPANKDKLIVTLDTKPTEDIYIKAYVGSRYEDDGWKELYSITYGSLFDWETDSEYKLMVYPYEVASHALDGKSVNMFIKYNGEDTNLGFMPYYARFDATELLVNDTHINGNGSAKSDCEFFFRKEVEDLETSELLKYGDLWPIYVDFVNENLVNVPNDFDSSKIVSQNEEYDIETVTKLINQYFKKNLKYDLEPGKRPGKKDFTEYFLYENKKGFCVHFATAATLIYRNCGYPARYVEGYCISKEEFKAKDDGTYVAEVKDGMAHAWTEVFDEDTGWSLREHTNGYSEDSTNSSNVSDNSTGEKETTTKNNSNDGPKEEITTAKREEITTKTEKETGGTGNTGDKDDSKKGFFVSGLGGKKVKEIAHRVSIVAIIAVLLVLMEAQKRIRYKLKIQSFRKKKNNQGIANIYNAMYKIGVFCGMKCKDKSDKAVFLKMIGIFDQLEKEEWEWLQALAERGAYGNETISNKEINKMIRYYRLLRKNMMSEMGIIKKIVFVYVLCL